MAHIQVLDQVTIDKIAAGEVVERPASVVKELVENAIDARAASVVVEIREGGLSFIRITDNGCGIARQEVPDAFLRHSTSKIRRVEDLTTVSSLGFRGEALSSISAVAQVELITKTKEDVLGTKYTIEGGIEKSVEDIGAPDGTTFLVHQLFYNTPARRKFMKTPMTEASHVSELLTRLALSHPEVSFQFLNNAQTKLHTSGNGNLKDAIYSIYGREIANHLVEIDFERAGIHITGYLGEPVISRGNRNFENFFVNGRYVKSNTLSKAVEDAYKDFSMQHKYPFVVLHFDMSGETIDVNVHPTKMELRFSNQQAVYNLVYEAVQRGLSKKELIPEIEIPEPPLPKVESVKTLPDPKAIRSKETEPPTLNYFMDKMTERVNSYHNQISAAEVKASIPVDKVQEAVNYRLNTNNPAKSEPPTQLELFDDKLLSKKAANSYEIIGQIFDTYWLVQFQGHLYIIDQHAAHERILYEKTLKNMKNRDFTSQYLSPPIILSLTMSESQALHTYMDRFTSIGFEIEAFGGDEYAVRAVPDNLFSIAKQELLIEMLDSLTDEIHSSLSPNIVDEKVASMSCKAAVKGNSKLSAKEVDVLIGDLLALDNPYHCPHGRPTIISMSKRELEKKFKRIV